MKTSGRKITAWIAAAGLAGLGLAAGVLWKDVLVHFHYLRLGEDPELLAGMIEQPDGDPQRVAARKYVEMPEGRSALRRALARRMFALAEESSRVRIGWEPVTVELVDERGAAAYVAFSDPRTKGSSILLGVPLLRFAGFIEMLGPFSTTGDLSFEEEHPDHPELSLKVFAFRDALEGGEERIGVRCDIRRRPVRRSARPGAGN